jgi:hypothetical protein
MEAVLFIVVAAFLYSMLHVVKSLASKDAGVDAKPVAGEVFPTIEVFNEEPEVVAPSIPEPPKRKNGLRPSAATPPPVDGGDEKPGHAEQSVNGKLARLSERSEAKTAFIYSELFNRKYQ